MAYTIHTGNVLDILPTLPANSVQCCVTSPPYWGLRDYQTGTWEGGDPECDHKTMRSIGASTLRNDGRDRIGTLPHEKTAAIVVPAGGVCPKCGARRIDQQLGSEATPEEYVANMVAVFREVRRVLREDGTLWLNLGDSYNGSGGAGGDYAAGGLKDGQPKFGGRNVGTLKPKDLVGIPWRVALALQADGWWLRSDIIWHKPNPMPESVTDRPTKAHEYIFLLTKSARYYYDAEAVKENSVDPEGTAARYALPFFVGKKELNGCGRPNGDSNTAGIKEFAGTRNRRDVWSITTKPYREAHFAVFPPELPELCILAGTSTKGACPECGAPWERCVEKEGSTYNERKASGIQVNWRADATNRNGRAGEVATTTTGWQPTCACDCKDGERENTVPCVVLDPFTGSGTTGAVAVNLGRNFVGCELNPAYVELAHRRIGNAQPALFGI